jgi:mRNA interferase MazF
MPTAGDVVVFDFPGALGFKRRPAVIVSSDLYHRGRPDVIVGVITSNISAANTPTDYLLQDWAIAGLRKPSAFRVYLVTTLPSSTHRIGGLSQRDWDAVHERVRLAIG